MAQPAVRQYLARPNERAFAVEVCTKSSSVPSPRIPKVPFRAATFSYQAAVYLRGDNPASPCSNFGSARFFT